MIHVVVTLIGLSDRMDALSALLAYHSDHTRREPGCQRFEVLSRVDAPCRFMLHETWADQAALDAHRLTPHYARWRAEVPPLLAGPRTHEEFTEIPIGNVSNAQTLRLVVAPGCFDGGLHLGHLQTLQEARRQGDRLIVALNSDESVRALKGPSRPIHGVAQRKAVLEALRCVDEVRVFGELAPISLIRELRPAVLVKGAADWAKEIPEAAHLHEWGGAVYFAAHLPGHSTTATVARIISRSACG